MDVFVSISRDYEKCDMCSTKPKCCHMCSSNFERRELTDMYPPLKYDAAFRPLWKNRPLDLPNTTIQIDGKLVDSIDELMVHCHVADRMIHIMISQLQ